MKIIKHYLNEIIEIEYLFEEKEAILEELDKKHGVLNYRVTRSGPKVVSPGRCDPELHHMIVSIPRKIKAKRETQTYKVWKTTEIIFLTENWMKMPTKKICKTLGRTYWSVVGKVRDLGISKKRKNATPKDHYKIVKANAGKKKASEIAKMIKRSKETVFKIAKELGVSLRVNKIKK
jgi:hypothetical protein